MDGLELQGLHKHKAPWLKVEEREAGFGLTWRFAVKYEVDQIWDGSCEPQNLELH